MTTFHHKLLTREGMGLAKGWTHPSSMTVFVHLFIRSVIWKVTIVMYLPYSTILKNKENHAMPSPRKAGMREGKKKMFDSGGGSLVRARVPKKSKAHPQIRGSDPNLRGIFRWGPCFGSKIGGLSKYPLRVLYALGRAGRGNTEKARASVPQPWHAPTMA